MQPPLLGNLGYEVHFVDAQPLQQLHTVKQENNAL